MFSSKNRKRGHSTTFSGFSYAPGSERSGASLVSYHGYLWLAFGYGGGGRLDDLHRFDLKKRVWQKIEPRSEKKPMPRENNGAVVVGSLCIEVVSSTAPPTGPYRRVLSELDFWSSSCIRSSSSSIFWSLSSSTKIDRCPLQHWVDHS